MNSQQIIQYAVIVALPLIFAITVHETAHGWMASKLGDQTARMLGRLTLNPVKHIDPIGTLLVPALLIISGSPFLFGWAKPVPVVMRNLKKPRRDMAIVAAAGPISNLLMAVMWGAVAMVGQFLQVHHDLWLGIPLEKMGLAGIFINAIIGVLNLLPIPPLDGGRVLTSCLRGKVAYYFAKIEPYGFIILIVLLLTGILGKIIGPITHYIFISIASVFQLI